jgi:hypothetical protein
VACGQREHTLGGIDAENMAGAAAGEPARECAVAAPDIQYVAAGDSGQQAGEGRLLQVLIESRAALAHLLVARENAGSSYTQVPGPVEANHASA